MVNKPSVFEPPKFYCILSSLKCPNSNRSKAALLLQSRFARLIIFLFANHKWTFTFFLQCLGEKIILVSRPETCRNGFYVINNSFSLSAINMICVNISELISYYFKFLTGMLMRYNLCGDRPLYLFFFHVFELFT